MKGINYKDYKQMSLNTNIKNLQRTIQKAEPKMKFKLNIEHKNQG